MLASMRELRSLEKVREAAHVTVSFPVYEKNPAASTLIEVKPYQYLLEAAMTELRVVGKSLPRIHARQKVTGATKYGTDIELPRMLYAKVLRSKYAHAKILRIDTSEAERMPGVKAVITAKDMPKDVLVETPYSKLNVPPPYSMARDKVRYIGEEVAAVAAEDELIAEEALGLIKVEYEELPAVCDPEEAMKPRAPKIHDVDSNIMYEANTEFGDIAQGFREANYIFEDRFATHHVHPCPLEPTVCIASFDSSGKLTFQENSLNPFLRSKLLPNILGIPPSMIKVVQKFIGGNFGSTQGCLTPYVICALLAKECGRPVRLVYTREEEFLNSGSRNIAVSYLKTGVKKDGSITARDIKVIINGGAYLYLGPKIIMSGFTPIAGLYRCPNVKFEGKCVYTNTAIIAPYRSFGIVPTTFAVESMMDIIAEKLSMDPIELRLKNATITGDVTVVGQKITSCGLAECMDKTRDHVGWEKKRARRQPNRGIGMACGMFDSEIRNAPFAGSVAYVQVLPDGRIRINSGEYEWGQGSHTVLSQIAAEELDIPLETVEFAELDTETLPFSLGPYGGGPVTLRGGNAVRLAATDARRQLFATAAEMLSVRPEDLEMKDQKLWAKGQPGKALSIADVASYAKYDRAKEIIGRGHFEPDTVIRDAETFYGHYSSGYTFVAQIAEVEVDPETGKVKVLNFASGIDLGKAINPMAAEGQNEGGLAQEVGPALMEYIMYDEKGRILNPNLTDYRLPTALDVPPIKSFLIESNEPNGPYGAKACGQLSNIPTSAAIANAIYNAVGVRVKDLPITPVKILKALEQKGR